MVFSIFRYLFWIKVIRTHVFLKNGRFFLKPTGDLLILLIHFKSQHAVVRAVYVLSVAVFLFALAAIVFEILSMLLAK